MIIPAQFLNQNFHEIFVYHFLKMEDNDYIRNVYMIVQNQVQRRYNCAKFILEKFYSLNHAF
ncbi:MAG: hypothetical protein CNLJKLNK_00420 [Holosporales bacterium]